MDNELYRIIERIYIEKDFKFFENKCKKRLSFVNTLVSLAKPICSLVNHYEQDMEPSLEMYFLFEPYENNISIEFQTILQISKVSDIFIFQHEYSMDNPVKNRMTPILDGYGCEAYIEEQWLLEEVISKFLSEKGYKKVTFQQLNEVVPNINVPDNNLFGSQMTLETALFRDTWDICG